MSVSFSSGVSIENGVRLVQPPAMISISSQPTNNTVNYGANGRFAVTAAITRGAPLSYQWQKQENSTGSWINISGATTSSYNVASAVYPDDDNDSYRVVMTGGLNANTLTSNSATLSVTPSVITITNQSSLINTSANETNRITFSVNASITLDATISYQWQKQDSGSASWNDISSEIYSSYTTGFLTNADDNGDSYRVRISGTKGATTVYSNTATLTVNVASYPNSFVTANENNFFGAGDGTQSYFLSGTAFGEITSDYISSIAYYGGTEVGGKTVIELKEGTHTGTYDTFTVTNGAIDGDGPGDIRLFSIGNTLYWFQYDGYDAYFRNYKNTDTLYLPGEVGYRTGIFYPEYYQVSNQAEAIGISTGIRPDTITVPFDNKTYYGFNIDYNDMPIFGFSYNLSYDYFKRIVYDETNTVIKMNPGQYDLGGSNTFIVQSNNAIGGDTTGSTRYFKVSGNNYTFTYSSSTGLYSKSGDTFDMYNKAIYGQVFIPSYDPSDQPSQGGGSGGGSSGGAIPISFGYWGGPPPSNALTLTVSGNGLPSSITALDALGADKTITLVDAVDPNTSVTIVGSLTKGGPFGPGFYSYYGTTVETNPNAETAYVNLTAIVPPASSGGGGGTTYTAGTDYADGNGGPSGVAFAPVGGPYSYPQFVLYGSSWTNTAGFDALKALTSGSTFTVSAYPDGGGSPVTSTITLLSDFTNPYGSQWRADMSSSPTVSTGSWPNYVPLSVTLGGGGGGGGGTTTVALWFGAWDTSGMVSFQVQASDTENVNKMDGIPSGATLTITDVNNNTTTITLTGALSKAGPGGPPSNQRYFWDGFATTTNPNYSSGEYGFITSLTYNT